MHLNSCLILVNLSMKARRSSYAPGLFLALAAPKNFVVFYTNQSIGILKNMNPIMTHNHHSIVERFHAAAMALEEKMTAKIR